MEEPELLLGKVQYDNETGLYRGKVLHICEIEEFEANSVEELRLMMAETLDEEDAVLSQLDDPIDGKLVLKLDPYLRLQIVDQAELADLSLTEWIIAALEQAVDKFYFLEPA